MTGPPPIGEPELEFCRRCSTCVAPGYLGRNAMGQRAFSVVFMPGHPRRLASCSAIVFLTLRASPPAHLETLPGRVDLIRDVKEHGSGTKGGLPLSLEREGG